MTVSGKANVPPRKNTNRAPQFHENSYTAKLYPTAHHIQSHILLTSFFSISLMPFTLLAHGTPRLNSEVWLSRSPILCLFLSYCLMKTLCCYLYVMLTSISTLSLTLMSKTCVDPHIFFLKSVHP